MKEDSQSREPHVSYQCDPEGVVLMTLSNPPVNALPLRMYDALSDSLSVLCADVNAKVAIMTGWGKQAFCAGADVREFQGLNRQQRLERHAYVTRVYRQLGELPLPVICAINGPAIGGGYGIACLCDYRVMASGAFISMPEIRRGTVGGGGAMARRLGVHAGVIREMHLTGRRYEAPDAHKLGLVDCVVDSSAVLDASRRLAIQIAAHDRDAIILTKAALATAEQYAYWLDGYEATHELSGQMIALPFSRDSIDEFIGLGRQSEDRA